MLVHRVKGCCARLASLQKCCLYQATQCSASMPSNAFYDAPEFIQFPIHHCAVFNKAVHLAAQHYWLYDLLVAHAVQSALQNWITF